MPNKRSNAVWDRRERSFAGCNRMRGRSLAGFSLTNLDGLRYPEREDGWQDLEIQGMPELMKLIEYWACPVTIAPPEHGVEFWSLELEDGTHMQKGRSILDDTEDDLG